MFEFIVMVVVLSVVSLILKPWQADVDDNEPACWWTESDTARFRETLIITDLPNGKKRYFSPAHGNIYGENFEWIE